MKLHLPPALYKGLMSIACLAVMSTAGAETLDVDNVAAVYVGNDGLTAQGPVKVTRSGNNKNSYTFTLTQNGSYNDAKYKTTTGAGKNGKNVSFWSDKDTSPNNEYTGGNGLAGKKLDIIEVAEGESLYLGGVGNRYSGTIEVIDGGDRYATVGTYSATAGTYYFGKLAGSGDLLLQATNTSGETVFEFNETDTTDWFSGRIYQSSNGGTVSTHVAGTHWSGVVFDFTDNADFSDSPMDTTGSAPQDINLVLTGNVRIKGLDKGDDTADLLVENSIGSDYTLTFGTNEAEHYSYGGRLAAGLNLTKVGSNVQTITANGANSVFTQVDVQDGVLEINRAVSISSLLVEKGAELQTGLTAGIASATLYGGSTWELGGTATLTQLQLAGMDQGAINLTGSGSLTISDAFTYTAKNLSTENMLWWNINGADVSFSNGLTLNGLNVTGETASFKFAQLSNFATLDLGDINVNATNGHAYIGTQRTEGNTVYIDLEMDIWPPVVEPETGFIWSGERDGTTIDGHRGLVMGHTWRSDGISENTGWHEQSLGHGAGVYVDGTKVVFGDTNYHGDAVGAEAREVLIEGAVAPGLIHVIANQDAGVVSNGGEARLKFGYALDATDGKITITDFVDEDGNVPPTKIVKDGKAMLVLGSYNTFTGGIEVNQGGLYLAAVGAAGQGTITVHTDNQWDIQLWQSNSDANVSNDGKWITRSVTGTEIMVCYLHETGHTSGYRSPSITNDIVMVDNDPSKPGQLTISFSTAAYTHTGTQNHENLPRHWRHLTLSGALVGTGNKQDKLILTGYSSTWGNYHDGSYITSININENTKSSEQVISNFNGTVELKNTINTSPLRSNCLDKRTAGTVQVMLQGNKLQYALMDMTRESVVMNDSILTDTPLTVDNGKTRQTYNNILVLSGDVGLRGLKADFHGTGYIYPTNGTSNPGSGFETLAQNEEVWHVRTVVNSTTHLTIGAQEDDANAVYVYSGAMGFTQSYAEPTEGHVFWGDGFEVAPPESDDFWKKQQGGFHNGITELSLTKRSGSAQYIHTALLQDVSLYGGTLGFNHLELLGNINLVGGTSLQLGVTGGETDWKNIAANTTSSFVSQDGEGYAVAPTSRHITVNNAKTLTVYTPMLEDKKTPATAWVDGDVTLAPGAALTFNVQGIVPSTNADHVLLDIVGTLSLQNQVTINFTGVDFSTVPFSNQTYYLAAANNLSVVTFDANGQIVGTADSSTFDQRLISLGYGYFAVLDTIDSNTEDDYLVMKVSGDPRRTWSGMTEGHIWMNAENTDEASFDYRWKENLAFENGQVVLFGNLYQPTEWKEATVLTSEQTVIVGQPKHDGVVVSEADSYAVDGSERTLLGAQKVQIQGDVAPVSVILNSEYTLDGSPTNDATAYYFYGEGCIRDATPDELDAHGFDTSWKTNLQKMGGGMVVMATANSYSGGSWLLDGTFVMQNARALGTGDITIMNGAVLWGDFNDAEYDEAWHALYDGAYIGEGMRTTTIANRVIANVYVDPDNPGYDSIVDARIANSHDNKLVLTQLLGESDTVVTLYGVSSPASGENMEHVGDSERPAWTYAVFKVLDPSAFYGTIRMDGNLWGASPDAAGGNVQLEIMTTAKSDTSQDEVATRDWLNTNIDLSIAFGTERTVLALDPIEVYADGSATPEVQEAVINSLTGGGNNGERINSSVINMSEDKSVTLVIRGLKNGDYDGVLGFGEFQRTTDYSSYGADYRTDIPAVGETCHHYGCGDFGDLNVRKEGAGTTQSVYDAWLDQLEVAGGTFVVDHALQVRTIISGAGQRVFVGSVDNQSSVYALTVGAHGILSMDTKLFDGNSKYDAFGTLKAGVIIDNAGWIQLRDGATLTAHTDWYTATQVDIYPNAAITINTHNYTPDAYITSEHAEHAHIDKNGIAHEHFNHFGSSHIIQLLGELTGQEVSVTFNNRQISPGASETEKAADADGLGYAAIKDHNMLSGSLTVESRTVLQILNSATQEADMEVTLDGTDAAMQVVENAKTQYISKLNLGMEGGALLLGGEEKTSLKNADDSALESLDWEAEGVQLSVQANAAWANADAMGSMNNVHTNLAGNAATLGGDDAEINEARYVHLTAHSATGTHKVHDTHFHYSLVELKDAVSVDMSDMVYVASHSMVRGTADAQAPMPLANTAPLADAVTHSLQDFYDNFVDPTSGTLPRSAGESVYVSADTTVDLTVTDVAAYITGNRGLVLAKANQFQDVDVVAFNNAVNGLLTIQLTSDYFLHHAFHHGAQYVAIQIGGTDGQFLFEDGNGHFLSDNRILIDARGNDITSNWVASAEVAATLGIQVSPYMLYIAVPEPTTTTLSLLALSFLLSRRRRGR